MLAGVRMIYPSGSNDLPKKGAQYSCQVLYRFTIWIIEKAGKLKILKPEISQRSTQINLEKGCICPELLLLSKGLIFDVGARPKIMKVQIDKHERLGKIQAVLFKSDLSAIICSHNINVLMLSGYWPVTGTAVAIATAEPRVVLIVPADEEELAKTGWADEVHTFEPASLISLEDPAGAVSKVLKRLLPALGLETMRVSCEAGVGHITSAYVSQYIYGNALQELVHKAIPAASLYPAGDILQTLRMSPTRSECERLRVACRIAAKAYESGVAQLTAGTSEIEAVLPFQHALIDTAAQRQDVGRTSGFFYCMSGVNAAQAYAAFQRSRYKPLQSGEPILIHCNSCVDGYWTDLTRTYVLGTPDTQLARMYSAILTARDAALDVIRSGIRAADVDRAARDVIIKFGYGDAFKHATGHGVGFTAIDHAEKPRIHPHSPDVLEPGMVFNVEPGIYIAGYGGLRDCNMVAVTDTGYDLLSPFHLTVSDMQRTTP
jgi:Xaa-Pro aminopeptidase